MELISDSSGQKLLEESTNKSLLIPTAYLWCVTLLSGMFKSDWFGVYEYYFLYFSTMTEEISQIGENR